MIDRGTHLTCANCGEPIVVGQHRVPTDDGPVHAGCIVDRESRVEYRDGSMRTDDLVLFLEASADVLPDWMIEAERHHSLREGPVGVLEQLKDGSLRFRTEGRYEQV